MAVRNDRGVDLIALEHFQYFAMGIIINASEPGADERASSC
jgi:hypothetical protein